ncbi:hypothetical protein Schulenberg_080 [Escherichia phage Schulenburg]|nr:hypothetical protein Schulenberg_080 [Escherichia phage Schulenburg]
MTLTQQSKKQSGVVTTASNNGTSAWCNGGNMIAVVQDRDNKYPNAMWTTRNFLG